MGDYHFTWENSRLVRTFEPEYQLVIAPDDDYSIKYVFWAGGNRHVSDADPTYEVTCK